MFVSVKKVFFLNEMSGGVGGPVELGEWANCVAVHSWFSFAVISRIQVAVWH